MHERVLAVIQAHIDEHGYAPDWDHIQEAAELHRQDVRQALAALRSLGLCEWRSGKRRSLVLNTKRELFVRRLRQMLRDYENGVDWRNIARMYGVTDTFAGQLVKTYGEAQ